MESCRARAPPDFNILVTLNNHKATEIMPKQHVMSTFSIFTVFNKTT
jgi:hypothetical protein